MKPLAIDLYCGLGGWAEGFLAEGYRVIGFDIERHDYGTGGYPGELVIQDVLTLDGSQFVDAAVIVASPPCQAYSYRAMPWKRAKALPPPDNSLFDVCFRIQREACESAGRHIPLVVENVRGAQKWVGRARWHHGSYFLWGDVPALMPITWGQKFNPDGTEHGPGSWFAIADSKNRGARATKIPNQGLLQRHPKGISPQWRAKKYGDAIKVPGNKLSENGFTIPVARTIDQSLKPNTFALTDDDRRQHLSFSRKAASAMIAKIPLPLAQHIAQVFRPTFVECELAQAVEAQEVRMEMDA